MELGYREELHNGSCVREVRATIIRDMVESCHPLIRLTLKLNKRIFFATKITVYYCEQCRRIFVLKKDQAEIERICKKAQVPFIAVPMSKPEPVPVEPTLTEAKSELSQETLILVKTEQETTENVVPEEEPESIQDINTENLGQEKVNLVPEDMIVPAEDTSISGKETIVPIEEVDLQAEESAKADLEPEIELREMNSLEECEAAEEDAVLKEALRSELSGCLKRPFMNLVVVLHQIAEKESIETVLKLVSEELEQPEIECETEQLPSEVEGIEEDSVLKAALRKEIVSYLKLPTANLISVLYQIEYKEAIAYEKTQAALKTERLRQEALLKESIRKELAGCFRLPIENLVSVLGQIAEQRAIVEFEMQKTNGTSQENCEDEELHIDGFELTFLGKKYSSKSALAKDFGVNSATFATHLKKGWTCKQALGLEEYIPPKAYFQGTEYESERVLAESFGVLYTTYKSRLGLGWTQEEALGIVPHIKPSIIFAGREYKSERELARAYGVKYSDYRIRRAYGWTREQALEIRPWTKKVVFNGKEYESEEELAKSYNIPYITYQTRLAAGWTQEEALDIGTVPYIETSVKKEEEPHSVSESISNTDNISLASSVFEREDCEEVSCVAENPKEEIDEKAEQLQNVQIDQLAKDSFRDEIEQRFDQLIKSISQMQDTVQKLLQEIQEKEDELKREEQKKKKPFYASTGTAYVIPPAPKVSLAYFLSKETIPWDHKECRLSKKDLLQISKEHSYKKKPDYSFAKKEQILTLLHYLKYSACGEIDPFELESAASEVFEWLSLNVGYNKRLGKYSITEFAGFLYDEIYSLQYGMSRKQIMEVFDDIDQLIFRVTRYIGLSNEDIAEYFSEEWDAPRVPDDWENKTYDYEMAIKPLDFSLLDKIRKDSDDIEEMLHIKYPDEDEYEEELDSSFDDFFDTDSYDMTDTWERFEESLNSWQIRILNAILSEQNVKAVVRAVSSAQHKMPEMLFDEINGQALDTIGDTLIDVKNDIPYIYDEYKQDIEQILKHI